MPVLARVLCLTLTMVYLWVVDNSVLLSTGSQASRTGMPAGLGTRMVGQSVSTYTSTKRTYNALYINQGKPLLHPIRVLPLYRRGERRGWAS